MKIRNMKIQNMKCKKMSPSCKTCLCFTLFPPVAPGPAGVEHLPGPLPLGQLLLAGRQGQLQPPLLPSLLPLPAPLLLVHLAPPRPLRGRRGHLPPLASRVANRPSFRPHPRPKPKAKGVAQELQREAKVSGHLKRENINGREKLNTCCCGCGAKWYFNPFNFFC